MAGEIAVEAAKLALSAVPVVGTIINAVELVDDARTVVNPNAATAERVVAAVAIAATVLGSGAAGRIVRRVGGAKILFGQKSVRRIFKTVEEGSTFEFAGHSIADVAKGLRRGSISADQIPVEYIVHAGERVAVNNRSLTALRRAGLEPTRTIDVSSDPVKVGRVIERLGEMEGNVPSEFIRIRGHTPSTSAIF